MKKTLMVTAIVATVMALGLAGCDAPPVDPVVEPANVTEDDVLMDECEKPHCIDLTDTQ